jgi:hypothetical protein
LSLEFLVCKKTYVSLTLESFQSCIDSQVLFHKVKQEAMNEEEIDGESKSVFEEHYFSQVIS